MAEHILRARELTKLFGDFTAVNSVSFEIETGESFGFLGPNGAGKTSTMRMISAVSQPSSGTISIFGLDPRTHGPEIRSRLGVVPQEDTLELELSVRLNLEMFGRYFDLPRRLIRERTDELLEFAQLTDRANDKVDNLSGGLKRRLTIARALINQPELLILDEPTTGLDPRTRNDLWQFVENLVAEGTTVLLTTQYMEEAEHLADGIVVIDGGTVVAQGTADELKDRLGGDVLEARVSDRADLARAISILSDIATTPPRVDTDLKRISIPTKGGAKMLIAAGRLLDDNGIALEDLGIRRPSLDDVFLAITGQAPGTDSSDLDPTVNKRALK